MYKFIYLVTAYMPKHGAKLVDAAIFALLGNGLWTRYLLGRARQRIARLPNLKRICVLADLNIGDAIFGQSLVSGLRDFFPHATIDMVINRSAQELMQGSAEITYVWPVYTNSPFPSSADMAAVNELFRRERYELIFNMSPFLPVREIAWPKHAIVVDYTCLAALILRTEPKKVQVNHMIHQMRRLVHLLWNDRKPVREADQ